MNSMNANTIRSFLLSSMGFHTEAEISEQTGLSRYAVRSAMRENKAGFRPGWVETSMADAHDWRNGGSRQVKTYRISREGLVEAMRELRSANA